MAGAKTGCIRYDVSDKGMPKGGRAVRRIVLDAQYSVMTRALTMALERQRPDFLVQSVPAQTRDIAGRCRSCGANVLLLEVCPQPPRTLADRLQLAAQVRTLRPPCKTVLLVDETAYPELAAAVCMAKKDFLVDDFVYASVSPTYLSALIDTL